MVREPADERVRVIAGVLAMARLVEASEWVPETRLHALVELEAWHGPLDQAVVDALRRIPTATVIGSRVEYLRNS